MSWDCPHWNNEICQLNGITCVPGRGQCVLKGRYEIKTAKMKESTGKIKLTTKGTKDSKKK